MQRLRSQVLAAGVLAFVACDTPPLSGAVATVTDSAGVEIVTSPEPASPLIRIDTVPDLSIGGPEDGGAAALRRIENVALGPDDSIWVSGRQAADVRVFNPDGSHRVTVGGRGDGPGEYALVRLLGVAGDSVAVQDAVSRPRSSRPNLRPCSSGTAKG